MSFHIIISALKYRGVCSGDPTEKIQTGFVTPHDTNSVWCYWYWIGDDISKEGITKDLEAMLGSEGSVLTPLRPVGMCDFDGKRVECVAETGYIDRESKIRVIHVEGTQLTVRLLGND